MLFKTVQIRCFITSHWSWFLTYLVLFLSVCGIFYVFFIPQTFLAIGPYILINNWTFIIISFIFIPTSLYIDHHFTNKDTNASLSSKYYKQAIINYHITKTPPSTFSLFKCLPCRECIKLNNACTIFINVLIKTLSCFLFYCNIYK